MSLTDNMENTLLDFLFGAGTNALAPASWYVGVSTADPGEDGSGLAEPVGFSYARVEIINDNTNFPNAASGSKSNGIAFDFPEATGNWGVLTHWAFFVSGVASTPEIYGALDQSKSIQSGDLLRIPAGSMVITAD